MPFFPDLASLTFTQLVFFAFATIGMTHIIVDSSIFAPVRDFVKEKLPSFFGKIIECYQCCGTWVGFFAAFWLLSWHPAIVFLGGCAGSFFAYSAAVMLTYFESQSVVQPTKDQ